MPPVLAVATDCVLTGNPMSPISGYSTYRKADQTINTPACGSGEATITVTKPVNADCSSTVTPGS